MLRVKVCYQSNYNGCLVEVFEGKRVIGCSEDIYDDEDVANNKEDNAKAIEVANCVTTFAYDHCDEDGEFCGCIDSLEDYAHEQVKRVFGQSAKFVFEQDDMSS